MLVVHVMPEEGSAPKANRTRLPPQLPHAATGAAVFDLGDLLSAALYLFDFEMGPQKNF